MSDVFTMRNEHSYAAFVGVLSTLYMKAHASAGFCDQAYLARIVCSENMTRPYRDGQEPSSFRLRAIADRMKRPAGRISLQILIGESSRIDSKYGLKHSVSQCWPIECRRNPQHVSVHLPPKNLAKNEKSVRYFEWDGGDVYISYETPIERVFDVLSKSRVHVCYQGGTAWLSVAMGVPTLVVYPKLYDVPEHYKTRLFGQHLGLINILDDGRIRTVRQHPCERSVGLKRLELALRDYT